MEQAKGKKDRYTILSEKTLHILRIYFVAYKPKMYLFEGQTSDIYTHYHQRHGTIKKFDGLVGYLAELYTFTFRNQQWL